MTFIIEMVRMSRFKEVRCFREGFATPYVPPARCGGWRMPETVDWQLSGCGVCEPDLRIRETGNEVSAELLANSLLGFFDMQPICLPPDN